MTMPAPKPKSGAIVVAAILTMIFAYYLVFRHAVLR